MMNINSAIFVPQGVPPPSILSPMPHMLTFMPPPPTPPAMQGILQRIHHGQQQQRHQQFMYQQYLHHQQQQQQQKQLHIQHQQQQQQQQQQHIFMRQQQQQQQKYANRNTHRMQEIQQIHQQQRLKRCTKNKPIQRRYLRPMHFDEWSNITQMRAHQTQQMSENDPNREEPAETIEQIFSNKVEYATFLYEKAQKYQVAEQQLQNEQKMQFQNYFRIQPQNGTKRQPLVAKYDNKKVKMQQNVAIQYDESAIRASVANKIGQNNNSSNNKPQQQQQQGNNIHHHGKNETNAVGQQQQANNNNNNVSQQSTPNHANKFRKSRNNNKHGNQSSPGKKQSPNSQDKQGTQKVTYWLETHYHVSTTNEDNLVSCHNSEVHRNSTSSEITCSDDLNSCSSNEDMEMQKKSNKSTARHANNNRQNKRQTKRKQNAANKQQQQQQQQQNQHNNNNNNQNGNVQQQKLRVQQQNTMDVDDVEESKENQIPTVITTNNNHRNYHNNNNNHNNNSNNNTAHKGRHAINNKRGKNTRISVLTKEPALVKTNSNSTVNIHSSNSSTTSNSANSSPTASPAAQKRSVDNIKKIVRALVPNYLTETVMPFLQITESQFYMALQRHLVPKNLLRVYGYPVESVFHEGCVEIFKLTPRSNFNSMRGIVNICDDMLTTQASPKSTNVVNPNDSGKGSSDISPPDLDCEIVEDEVTQPTASYQPDDNYQIFSQYDQSLKKKCVRCKASFHVTEGGQYVTREECVFHWGKKYQLYDAGQKLMDAYSCCNKELTAVGCSRNKLHVWNGAVMGINGPYTDFVYTYEHYNLDGTVRHSNKVFALDCEMSYTAHGLDLTKVTLINADGNIVYEKFVIPAAEIADYNTRFSGITQEDLCPKSNIALKTLPEVQRDLLEIISADSILIGHGLDNDLRALRMVHKTIVDTSVTYPHRNGFPYRLSLKHLARSYLGRNIQASGLGHSSLEDSLAALHLMYVKVQSDQYSSKAYE